MRLKSWFGTLGLVLALASAALTPGLHGRTVGGSDEENITAITALMLQKNSYIGPQETKEVSSKFLDHYLDLLDPNRIYFLRSDLDEFAPYRFDLEALALKRGDTRPAHVIFDRFLERLEQRVDYTEELLKTEKFDFTGQDSFQWDRRNAPRPQDLVEAKELWRQNLRYDYLQEKLGDRKPEEIVKTLSRRYDRSLHAMRQMKPDEVLETFLTALAHAYDPHSDYMGHRQAEDFSISMNLSFVGIGATLQPDDGYAKIRELVPGGPAARSKLLKVGDRIVAVAQGEKEAVDIVDMPLTEAVSLIRGPKGTVVRLTIIPANAADSSVRKTITLVRDEVKLEDQQAKARLVELSGPGGQVSRLGIIDLPSFYAGADAPRHSHASGASADVAKLLEKLKQEHVQGVILDIRHNGGGSLEEAIALTGLFIKRGPVVQTKDPGGKVQVESDPDSGVVYDGPLVVLTSHLSASASEILAGALQDYGRAVVVGDASTFGKGTVQTVLQLSEVMHRFDIPVQGDPGELKLTVRKFYRPGGASTQLRGVASDIVVPSPTAVLKVGESEMHDPLPWDNVDPAPHAELDRVAPYVSTLRQASAGRIATNLDFVWLREDCDRIKSQLARPVVSLNEQKRRQEKAEVKARAEARKKERSHRQLPQETRYEIIVKNTGQPGLPEPLSATPETAKIDEYDMGDDSPAPAPPDKDAATDATLEEAQRILIDYIGLLKDAGSGSVARHVVPARKSRDVTRQ
jgi:carboxyl-terminal processing protease